MCGVSCTSSSVLHWGETSASNEEGTKNKFGISQMAINPPKKIFNGKWAWIIEWIFRELGWIVGNSCGMQFLKTQSSIQDNFSNENFSLKEHEWSQPFMNRALIYPVFMSNRMLDILPFGDIWYCSAILFTFFVAYFHIIKISPLRKKCLNMRGQLDSGPKWYHCYRWTASETGLMSEKVDMHNLEQGLP